MNSRFAITALAGLVAGGLSITSASAADLGGNCCADLEERIAELEATTVRKGNRKMSVQLSGFVGHQIMWWDDGHDSAMYIGDGGNYGSRFRFKGSATIRPGLTAGFLYEFGISDNSISSMTQTSRDDAGGGFAVRDTTIWIRDKRLGMIKLGHGSTATDNLILIDLGQKSGAATPDVALYNGSFSPRSAIGGLNSGANWAAWLRGTESFDTSRRNHVLYETPTLAGFTLQTAFAEENGDFWDIALRYANEWNGVRVAFGIGYLDDNENNVDKQDFKGSASILHVPTGLFVSGAWGRRDQNNIEANMWYLSGGVARNFTGLGNTVLYGEYYEAKNFVEQTGFNVGADDKVSMWGLGITQHIDAAAMEVYVAYKNYSIDCAGGPCFADGYADFSAVLVGSRVNF